MIICHLDNCIVPIHAHKNRSEYFKVEKGIIKYKIFTEKGKMISESIVTSKNERILVPKNSFHNFEIISNYTIFREWTSGPFDKNQTKIIQKI